ncbi:MAG: dockerin type I repeat-containing protein [Muribaculaceae bacterium]|nr:dockerin type I repeat-containing protein [Muribaculaceae bacterium]
MKKTIITMLIALVAMTISAETYNYLKFTKTNGSTLTYSVEGLKLTYDNSNVYVTNAETTATIALAEVQDMYFSNEAGGSDYKIGDVNKDGEVTISDVTALIDYLLGGDESTINVLAANVNGDDEVTIADVTALIDLLLSGSTN